VRRFQSCLTLDEVETSLVRAVLSLESVHASIGLEVQESTKQASALSCVVWLSSKMSHPLGKLKSRSLPGPSLKLATLNQLVGLSPFSLLGPALTPIAYRTISRPVDVGVSSGWSARRPMSCIRASEWAGEVEKARAPLRTRGTERAANIVMWMDVFKRCSWSCRALSRRKTRRDRQASINQRRP
jgi:hypothetical protein